MAQIQIKENKVYIKDNEDSWKYIGKKVGDNILEISRNMWNHRFHLSNSYGINKDVIDSKQFEYILLNEFVEDGNWGLKNTYIIPVNELEIMPIYKAKDFETQIMINLKALQSFKTT